MHNVPAILIFAWARIFYSSGSGSALSRSYQDKRDFVTILNRCGEPHRNKTPLYR
jgi:hypothetical protein